jgi:hypothetical protein
LFRNEKVCKGFADFDAKVSIFSPPLDKPWKYRYNWDERKENSFETL